MGMEGGSSEGDRGGTGVTKGRRRGPEVKLV